MKPVRARIRPPPPASCGAIVVAAGQSLRMGGKVRKPYLSLRGRPILSWTLTNLGRIPGLRQIVLVTRSEDRRLAMRALLLAGLREKFSLDFADGGARRQDSVLSGLRRVKEECELVLIHDAARPFPPPEALLEALAAARQTGAAILAIPVRDTVKRETAPEAVQSKIQNPKSKIGSTVPRAGLWLAQTPQVFRRELILALSERLAREAPEEEVTDDAAVCERFGQAVTLIPSQATNFKLTRPEDLLVAEALLQAKLLK